MFKSADWKQLEAETKMMKAIEKIGIPFMETLDIGSYCHPRYYDSDIVIVKNGKKINIDLKDINKGTFTSKNIRIASLLKHDAHTFILHEYNEQKKQYRVIDPNQKGKNLLISAWYKLVNELQNRRSEGEKSFTLTEFVNPKDYTALTLAMNSQCILQEFPTDFYAVDFENTIYMIPCQEMVKYIQVYRRGMINKPMEHEPQILVDGEWQNLALCFKVLKSALKKDIDSNKYQTIQDWYNA